jgi:hypothetical protein
MSGEPEIRTCLICDQPFEVSSDEQEICEMCQTDEWEMIGPLEDEDEKNTG